MNKSLPPLLLIQVRFLFFSATIALESFWLRKILIQFLLKIPSPSLI